MKKKIMLLLSLFLIGCSKDDTTLEKGDYLALKEELLIQDTFSKDDELNFDLTISIDKINEEEVSYRAIIDNPKENMHKVKVLVIHEYFSDEIFPSIGIFDEPIDLLVNNEEVKGINLVGYIKTNKSLAQLDLNIKVYLEYLNDNNELIKIYYESTN